MTAVSFHGKLAAMKTSILMKIGLAAAGLLQADAAFALVHVWQGPANGLWSVAGNWTNGAPGSGDEVDIGSNATPVCDINTTVAAVVFTGTGANLQSDGSHTLSINAAAVTDNIVNQSGSNTLSLPIAITTSSLFFRVDSGTLTMSSVLSGAFAVRVKGPGTTVFNGTSNNTYTGTTSVQSGVLLITSTSAGSIIPGDVVIGGQVSGQPPGSAILRLGFRDCISNTSNVTVNSDGVLDLAGLSETVAGLAGTGSVTLGAAGVFTVAQSATTTFTGAITGSGTATFSKAGTGTLNVTGSLNAPAIVVTDGILGLGAAATTTGLQKVTVGDGVGSGATLQVRAAAQIPGTCLVFTKIDGILDLGTTVVTPGAISMTGGTITAAGGGAISLQDDVTVTGTSSPGQISCPVLLNGDRTFHVSSGSVQPEFVLTGVVSDGSAVSGIRKDGPGTMDLITTSNTYTGVTEVEQGVMRIKASSIVAIPGDLVIGNDFDPAGTAIVRDLTFGNDISPTCALTIHSSGILDLSTGSVSEHVGSLAGSGSINLGSLKLTVGSNGLSTEYDGVIGGTGGLIAATGAATLTLGGTSSFSGATTVSAGHLRLKGVMNSSGTVNVTDGGSFVVEAGDSASFGAASVGIVNPGNTAVLLVNGNATASSLTVNSSGVATIDGHFIATGGITVASGGLLNGDGQAYYFPSPVASGAVISPGDVFPGTLEMLASTAFSSGSTLRIKLNEAAGQASGHLKVEGNLNLGLSTLALDITGPVTRNAYVVASYASLSGAFNSVTGLPSGYTVNYNYADGSPLAHVALVKPGLVTTGAASAITGTSAKLSGTVNPAGKTTSWYFQYGPTNTYGSRTATVGGLNGSASIAVAATLAGLGGGTTYHYQLVAVNSGGPVYGADLTFTTPGPQAITNPPSSISALSATLGGTVNYDGSQTTAWLEYGPTQTLGMKTPPVPFSGGGSYSLFALVQGLTQHKVYYYRIVASNAGGTTRGALRSFTTKLVLPPVFLSGGVPPPSIIAVGTSTALTVGAVEGSPSPTDAPLTYQWYKNNVAIAGATGSNFIITKAALTAAGDYICSVRNVAGSVATPPIQVGVVDTGPKVVNVPVNTTATLTAFAAGSGLTFQWYRDGAPLPNAFNKTLTVPGASAANAGPYLCLVTNVAGSIFTGTVTLSAYNAAPVILTPVALPAGIVGGSYSFTIPVDSGGNRAPTGFTATGLPPGLTVNSLGVISGRITAPLAASHSYAVTLRASNARGSSAPVSAALLVQPFPSQSTGTYNGLVDRHPTLNNLLGGTLNAVITSTGAFTGRLALGGASYPLTGVFYATTGNPDVSATLTVNRPGLHSLNLTFGTDAANGILAGVVSDPVAAASAEYVSYHNPWNATGHPYSKTGVFNTLLSVSGVVGNPAYPQGAGYAAVTVTAGGAVTWAGKLADGSAPAATYATTISQDEVIPVHLLVDASLGSAHGAVQPSEDVVPPVNNGQPLISGTLDWVKLAEAATSKGRVYKSGFPLFTLNAKGCKYAPPPANTPVLGLAPSAVAGTNNAHFTFTQGGLTGSETPLINKSFRVTPANTADFSNTGGNPGALKLTIAATTGAFSGSFTLTDGATRLVPFSGLLVPRTDFREGAGFFLLPGLAPSVTTSPILSGAVLLLPGP